MDGLTADQAYRRLREGNKRFLSDNLENAARDQARRKLLADRQRPFAAILRVPRAEPRSWKLRVG